MLMYVGRGGCGWELVVFFSSGVVVAVVAVAQAVVAINCPTIVEGQEYYVSGMLHWYSGTTS